MSRTTTTTKLGRVQCLTGHRTYFALVSIISGAESTTIDIILTDVGRRAWIGSLDSDFIMLHAQRAKCTVDEYVSMTVSCLIEPSSDAEPNPTSKFVCQVKELDNGQAELTWKRQLVNDGDISIKLGTITLNDSNLAEGLHAILTFGVSRIRELERLTEEQRGRERESELDRRTILDKLDQFVTAKEQMERELYAKFVAVLNEKKAEIRRLESSSSTQSDVETSKIIKNKKKSEPVVVPDVSDDGQSSDPDDFDTPQLVEHRKRPNCSEPIDLLLDDDGDERSTAPVPPRRARKIIEPSASSSSSALPPRLKVTVPEEDDIFDSQHLLADM